MGFIGVGFALFVYSLLTSVSFYFLYCVCVWLVLVVWGFLVIILVSILQMHL